MLDDTGSAEALGREASQGLADVALYLEYVTEGCAACSAALDQFEAQLAFLVGQISSFQGYQPTRQQIVSGDIQLMDLYSHHADATTGRINALKQGTREWAEAWDRLQVALDAFSRDMPLNTAGRLTTGRETLDAMRSLLNRLGQLHQGLIKNRLRVLGFRSKPGKSDRARQAEVIMYGSQIAITESAIAHLTVNVEILHARLEAQS